jgi:hypothetical protein
LGISVRPLNSGQLLTKNYALDSQEVQRLAQLVDESVRASREGVKHFVEPTSGVLAKAKSKRHNIIFGRRGSGKSSLLQKILADLTVDRTPIALVDLETFKQHSYPDVLLIGMKLGDDADEIDLDVTLEKYDVTKAFLLKLLNQFAVEASVSLPSVLADGARDRLVLASGGVARDFLTIFNRSIQVARERLISGKFARGNKVGSEDVNVAAGQQVSFKEEDFNRDTGTKDDRDRLIHIFQDIVHFCTSKTKANCILIEKDMPSPSVEAINELVDLKFLHRAKFRVTVRDRTGRLYDAYMLDLSTYTGERARQDFEMVKFWGPGSEDALRKASLIYIER